MKIGTYYYPEQWPRAQWARDFDHMSMMGMQIVHMGEFAWASVEPEEGRFEFDWLAECVELAAARHMSVILCTPTAVPPMWLMRKHPELSIMDDAGRRVRQGKRRHGAPTCPALIEAGRRIAVALAGRFNQHSAVIGWQIDNELSTDYFDQSDYTHAAFQHWLDRRYGTIEKLNAAWGCQFWNTYFTSFDQIQMPPDRSHRYGNPHHVLDACRFWSWAFAEFTRVQAEALRAGAGARFVTTNFMPFHPDANPADFTDVIDLWSWDAYPVTGFSGSPGHEYFRLADPSVLGLTHDHMAAFNRRWALMELQPGQVNWSGYPVLPYPGAVRLWVWTAFAHGAEFVTTYRFRRPLWGIELFHDGLVGTDGTTPSPGGRQFAQVISEMKRLDLSRVPAFVDEVPDPRHTVGLVVDFDQLWMYQIMPQAKRWDQPQWLRTWHGAIQRMGYQVRVLVPGMPWPKDLAMVVAPGVQMVDDVLVKQFTDYTDAGGHLLLTCRTGLMNRFGHLHEGPTAAPILKLIGGSIEAYDCLPPDTTGKVELDGKTYPWAVWGDLLYNDSESVVLARYADQFYSGTASVIQNRSGPGTVTYCGVYGEQAFVDALMEKLLTPPASAQVTAAKRAKAKTPGSIVSTSVALPARVSVLKRGPYRVLLNYQDASVEAPAPPGATFVVGQRLVEPAGVAVWTE